MSEEVTKFNFNKWVGKVDRALKDQKKDFNEKIEQLEGIKKYLDKGGLIEQMIESNTSNQDRIIELGNKFKDIGLGNTAKILNQNKIVADYAELKEQISELKQQIISKEYVEKLFNKLLDEHHSFRKVLWDVIEYSEFTTDYKNKLLKQLEDSKPSELRGCYQFTYCNECLAYPMGFDCPKKEARKVE